MSQTDSDSTDQRMDQALGHLLRGGVLLAAAVVLIGGIDYLAAFWNMTPHNRTFHGEPVGLRNPLAILRGAADLDPRGIIQLGLLLLIATPVARVFFTVVVFSRQRDWTYVVITLIVLSLLLFSLFWGS
jgi:uncharacterized membrane protein